MILSDRTLIQMHDRVETPAVISPFFAVQQSESKNMLGITLRKCISFGLSSYGYDLRLASKLRVFKNTFGSVGMSVIDPKKFDDRSFENVLPDQEGRFYLPPHSYALGMTVEMIEMPEDLWALCVGKSTYARCGLILNTTPLEPGWRGHVTLELANTAPLPLVLYANEGIAQVAFFKGDEPCLTSYARRKGKYQDQFEITSARV